MHKEVFPDVPLISFKNNKSLRDHLVRSQLPDIEETGMSKPCGGKRSPCHLCENMKNNVHSKVNTLMRYIKLTTITTVIQKWLFI